MVYVMATQCVIAVALFDKIGRVLRADKLAWDLDVRHRQLRLLFRVLEWLDYTRSALSLIRGCCSMGTPDTLDY
jgi:hypothetical protein